LQSDIRRKSKKRRRIGGRETKEGVQKEKGNRKVASKQGSGSKSCPWREFD